jgi:hypothetical protein
MPVVPALSSAQKDKLFEQRLNWILQRHFTPDPWKDLDSLQLELLCMYAEGKIHRILLDQGLQEAEEHFRKKKKKVRVG